MARPLQEDDRLAIFQAFLTEEWDMSTVVAYLRAKAAISQQAPITCVLYPNRDGAKGENPPWICLSKANWVTERVLGRRPDSVTARFLELMQEPTVQVSPKSAALAAERRKQIHSNSNADLLNHAPSGAHLRGLFSS